MFGHQHIVIFIDKTTKNFNRATDLFFFLSCYFVIFFTPIKYN